jgi:hypothetical protein
MNRLICVSDMLAARDPRMGETFRAGLSDLMVHCVSTATYLFTEFHRSVIPANAGIRENSMRLHGAIRDRI